MRIATWNVNGYNARVKDGSLAALLQQRYDVVCLQETKLGVKNPPAVVAGLHASWRQAEGGGRCGVCIFSREAPLRVLDSGVPEVDAEGRLLAVELPSAWIVSAYSPTFLGRPDREAYRMEYEPVLRSFAAGLISTGKPVVLCGDLNVTAGDIDCHQAPLYAGTPNHTAAEREAFRSLLDLGLTDVWRDRHPGVAGYSWIPVARTPLAAVRQYGSGFRFDYILASVGTGIASSDILARHPGSDHVPVVAQLSL